ncbi:MAG: hypothetical protein E3J76_04825 [Candidatus Aminicenantes bacterium]|nr:MAG: hypothetical protein E3J76_04825 [Candidatus Aminicenantes bacterium]
MEKIHWFEEEFEGDWNGYVFPKFKIYEDLDHNLRLFIMDDRPQSIIIKSVRQGKVKAKKYLDKKLFEEFGE